MTTRCASRAYQGPSRSGLRDSPVAFAAHRVDFAVEADPPAPARTLPVVRNPASLPHVGDPRVCAEHFARVAEAAGKRRWSPDHSSDSSAQPSSSSSRSFMRRTSSTTLAIVGSGPPNMPVRQRRTSGTVQAKAQRSRAAESSAYCGTRSRVRQSGHARLAPRFRFPPQRVPRIRRAAFGALVR